MIFVVLLIIFIPISFALETDILENFEVENNNNLGKEIYYYAGTNLIASSEDTLEYKYQDRLGSDFKSKSLPFGQSISIENRFSFTGKELDMNLYYFNARYYDPDLGKFTSVDPIKDNPSYTYVSNNPINLIDPTGMEEVRSLIENFDVTSNLLEDFHTALSDSPEPDLPNSLLGFHKYFVDLDSETWNYIHEVHQDMVVLSQDGNSVPEIAKYISGIAWDVFTYDRSRLEKNKYGHPYEDGNPSLIGMMSAGESVCYEKAMFTALVLETSDLISNEGWTPKYETVRFLKEDGPEEYAYHANVILIPPYTGPLRDQGEYVVDWGDAKPYDSYRSQFEGYTTLLSGSTGYNTNTLMLGKNSQFVNEFLLK
jgi:RHS repeat-associated protein